MKIKHALLILVIPMLLITSCKKETVSSPIDLGGTTWTGATRIAGLTLTQTFILNPNGILTGNSVATGSPYANEGTWSKTPNSNTVYMFYKIASVTGTYFASGTLDASGTKIENGRAVNSEDTTFNYTYSLYKR